MVLMIFLIRVNQCYRCYPWQGLGPLSKVFLVRSFFVASDSRGVYKQVGTLPVLRPGNVPNQSTY
jgi:hypothetical protein